MDNTSKLFAIVVGLAVLSALFTLSLPKDLAPADSAVQSAPTAAPQNAGMPHPATDQGSDYEEPITSQTGPAIENRSEPPSGSQPMQNL